MAKFKMLFMKSCTVAVIVYLSYPFLIETVKEVGLLYQRLIAFLLGVIKGDEIIIALCSLAICLLGLYLILWTFSGCDEEEIINEEKEEKA